MVVWTGHRVKGSEIFVGGFPRSVTESIIHEVIFLCIVLDLVILCLSVKLVSFSLPSRQYAERDPELIVVDKPFTLVFLYVYTY